MVPAVWERVVGREVPRVNALLKDYACRPVQGEVYPGLVPRKGGATRGVVYTDLNSRDLRRLDEYEGREYRRLQLSIWLEDGRCLPAWAYITRAASSNRLSDDAWLLEDFIRRDLTAYLSELANS